MSIVKSMFLLGTALVPFYSVTIPGYSYKDKFDYIEVPSLNLPNLGETIMKVKVSFARSKIHTLTVKITNSIYPDGKVIYTISRNSKYINATITYDNAYTREGSTLEFSATNAGSVFLTPTLTNFPAMTINSYDPDDYDYSWYYKDSTGWVDAQDVFQFRGFSEYYVPDYYHKVNLSEFQIYYEVASSIGVTYENASMIIHNYNGLFSDAGKVMGEYVLINLKLTKLSDSFYRLGFRDSMYVHPTTLLMSSTYKDGYVRTNHLYLPRGGMPNQDKYNIEFSVTKLGYSKVLFTHNMSIRAPIDTIGDCVNSEYCVGVSNSTPELELGDVEEH